ncbi:MAG: hypothetical protein J6E38_05750 [Clostridia bacterium]|nr:hypothetical protein [Clostridia bacterium]
MTESEFRECIEKYYGKNFRYTYAVSRINKKPKELPECIEAIDNILDVFIENRETFIELGKKKSLTGR